MRIMTWNIQDFAISKFKPTDADPGDLRQYYIHSTIRQVNPDILIVLEVETSVEDGRSMGSIVSDTSGGPAVRQLLWLLRATDSRSKWMVVPPIILGGGGKKEGIAVFFKNTAVDFQGPNIVGPAMYNDEIQESTSPPGPTVNWDDPWADALPVGQRNLAGRYQWAADGSHTPLTFPDGDSRQPYQTIFKEKAGTQRTFNIFSMHLPSKADKAVDAIGAMAKIPELIRDSNPNEIRIVTADFNINVLNSNYDGSYDPLIDLGYKLIFKNPPTHLATLSVASTAGTNPYYGFMSQGPPGNSPDALTVLPDTSGDWPRKLLDNFLVRPNNLRYSASVVNRVTGKQFAAIMRTSIPDINAKPGDQAAHDGEFRRIENFGAIRLGSDHLPIYIDL